MYTYCIAGYFWDKFFTNRKQFVKILPMKCLLFIRYSLQCMTIRENFPLEKLRIAQFAKIFPLENNPLYGVIQPHPFVQSYVHASYN